MRVSANKTQFNDQSHAQTSGMTLVNDGKLAYELGFQVFVDIDDMPSTNNTNCMVIWLASLPGYILWVQICTTNDMHAL